MATGPDIKELQLKIALFEDEKAYRQLFLHFHSSLQQFAFSILRSRPLAEETVSDVFIKIWKKRHDLHHIQHLKLYLLTATRNVALNYKEQQKRQSSMVVDDYWVELNSVYFHPEQLMLTAEMINRIHEAINALPPRCKMIFKLIREEGLKYREVAELLNLSQKTVENQMALALKKIGQAIGFDIYASISSRSSK